MISVIHLVDSFNDTIYQTALFASCQLNESTPKDSQDCIIFCLSPFLTVCAIDSICQLTPSHMMRQDVCKRTNYCPKLFFDREPMMSLKGLQSARHKELNSFQIGLTCKKTSLSLHWSVVSTNQPHLLLLGCLFQDD